MASKLNTDCLMEIFEILELDQTTTSKPCILYPCILVNRQWCLVATKLLWKNPWNFRKNFECVTYTIINTYISAFSKESKEKLIENKIFIPNEILSKTIFNYAKFLKYLNVFHLEITLESWFHNLFQQQQIQWHLRWLQQQPSSSSSSSSLSSQLSLDTARSEGICSIKYKVLFEELLKHFFSQSPCITNINVSACHDVSVSYLINSIEKTPQAIDCLANLQYFKSSGAIPKLHSLLSKISSNLTRLQIDRYIITDELANLINAQRNLKEVSFHKHPSLRHRPSTLSNSICKSLINKSSSINSLEIKGIYFQANILSNFENLRDLTIRMCGGMRYSREELLPLVFVSLKHLQTLFWHSTYYIYLDLFPNFFRNNGKNLRNITIKGFMISDPENAGLIINSIAKNCVNLKSFTGPILTKNVLELTRMFENCNELQSLSLHPSRKKCYGSQKKENFDELMNVLIDVNKEKKIKLFQLKLADSWNFTIYYFKKLMEIFEKIQKKKNFEFLFDTNILKDQEFKITMKKFVDSGVLKEMDGYILS